VSASLLADRLDKVKDQGHGKFVACCPAHDDRSPSLTVKELPDGRILIHCFAGCSPLEIVNAVGLTMGDLFPDKLERDFKPLYMASKQKKDNDHHRLIMSIADGIRSQGGKLTRKELEEEKAAFLALR